MKTPAEFIADLRAQITADEGERATLAPTLPGLRAALDTARDALDALPEDALPAVRDPVEAQYTIAQENHAIARNRYLALKRRIAKSRDEADEGEADPDSLQTRIISENVLAIMQTVNVDPASDEPIARANAVGLALLADIIEDVAASAGHTLTAQQRNRLTGTRNWLAALRA